MTVPCETCGKPTLMEGTKRCDGCYEVESRLSDYLKTPGGRAFVTAALAEANAKLVRVHQYHQNKATSKPRCRRCGIEVVDALYDVWCDSREEEIEYIKEHPGAVRCTE